MGIGAHESLPPKTGSVAASERHRAFVRNPPVGGGVPLRTILSPGAVPASARWVASVQRRARIPGQKTGGDAHVYWKGHSRPFWPRNPALDTLRKHSMPIRRVRHRIQLEANRRFAYSTTRENRQALRRLSVNCASMREIIKTPMTVKRSIEYFHFSR